MCASAWTRPRNDRSLRHAMQVAMVEPEYVPACKYQNHEIRYYSCRHEEK